MSALLTRGRGGDFHGFGQALDDYQGYVIGGGGALAEFCEGRFDAVAYAARGGIEVASYYFIESRRAKFFAVWIHSFRNAIRIDHQHVAGIKLCASLSKIRIRQDAQGQTSGSKLFHGAPGVNN